MNDDQLEDLKQFVASTVSQTEARLREEMELGTQRVDSQLQHLRAEMTGGFQGVGEAIETLAEHMDERINSQDAKIERHEQRLDRIEGRAA